MFLYLTNAQAQPLPLLPNLLFQPFLAFADALAHGLPIFGGPMVKAV